ncbi:PilZ domain-containing protein [Desulfovibrio ferrophilus]|uniref:Type IV pilus assembly PilZ n=1 Tax=Desulfovibrio ferrophilus TaxID=241368 RepID=A0A2Z6AVG7_9BACT|nr:PilZ domain-containing protein [Desulfovibrio ferrophilus]BBD07213.1 type IV pilus assembly PilZ [Desulfovibrio ferrophilus]
MAAEQRRDLRLPKNFRVEIKEFKFPLARQPKFEVTCADISAGGMKVECRKKFEAGTKLQVKIFIPSFNKYHPGFFKVFESDSGQFLQAIAEVVRADDVVPLTSYAMGVKFLDVDQDDWTALRNFIMRSSK